MTTQGTFDPNGYVAGNAATYPTPAAGVLYQPGMWWDVNPAGTFDGQPVDVGDRIYVQGDGRTYGELNYGDQIYGGPSDRNWTASDVWFFAWANNLPPHLQGPAPYSGCPFGDRHPGWRIVIDARFNAATGSRTYGTDTYGSDVYGDANGLGAYDWHDLTPAGWGVVIRRGTQDGRWAVDVDQIEIDIVDNDATVFDMAQPASWYRPQPGDQIRVGLFDPSWTYYPLAVGEIESIDDSHDTFPRLLSVLAYGFQMDLVTTLPGWRRGGEAIQTRTGALLAAAGWRWGPAPDYPQPIGPFLVADPEPVDVVARDELDRIAISAGWSADTARNGALRLREWPLLPQGVPLVVADCPGDGTAPADALTASRLDLHANYDQLLNVAELTNVWQTHRAAVDGASTGQHGRRSENYNFPLTGLASVAADMQPLADRYVNELGAIIVHVSGVEADTMHDARWLAAIAELDTGRLATVYRSVLPSELMLTAAVVGYELRLIPNRATASIFTRTTTPTTRGAP